MIYSYTKIEEEGIYGRRIDASNGDDGIFLGTVDGLSYIFFPSTESVPEQPEEIKLTQVNSLSKEVKEELKKQPYLNMYKESVRSKIDDISDVKDLIADCMKMIEFNMMLTSKLAADYFGTEVFDNTTKDMYAQRNQAFLDGVGSGNVLIRGSFEDATEMMNGLMARYSQINQVVKTDYIDKLKELGL